MKLLNLALNFFLNLNFALEKFGQCAENIISLGFDIAYIFPFYSVQKFTAYFLIALWNQEIYEWFIRDCFLIALVYHVYKECAFFQLNLASKCAGL